MIRSREACGRELRWLRTPWAASCANRSGVAAPSGIRNAPRRPHASGAADPRKPRSGFGSRRSLGDQERTTMAVRVRCCGPEETPERLRESPVPRESGTHRDGRTRQVLRTRGNPGAVPRGFLGFGGCGRPGAVRRVILPTARFRRASPPAPSRSREAAPLNRSGRRGSRPAASLSARDRSLHPRSP